MTYIRTLANLDIIKISLKNFFESDIKTIVEI